MPRTFFIFALAGFFAGVFLRSFVFLSLEFVFLLLLLSAVFGALFRFRPLSGRFLLYIAVCLAALSLGALRYDFRDSRENLQLLPGEGERVRLSGTIIADPQRQAKFTRAVLESDPPARLPDGQAGGAKILLTLPHYPEVGYGDRLEVEGKLREPENFGEFDWKAYLAKDNIYFEMFLPEIRSRQGGGLPDGKAGGWRLKSFLFSAKHAFLSNLSRVLPEPHASLLAGIAVGERAELPQSLKDDLRKVGVIHIVALSGYNISVVSDSVLKALGYLPLARNFQTLIAAAGIVLFAILTGGSASVARAAIMGILLLFARSTGKIYEATSALFAAAFLMVVINPKILRFDASFQLSFLATLGLILLSPRLERYCSWFPNVFKLREHLVATLSTQIFVLPLLLSIGGTFSWVTIPANLMILTAVPATMFLGFLAGLAGFISYNLSQLFAWPAYLFLAYELWVVELFSKLGS